MTSSYKYTTLCVCICPLNHYRWWKTVPAANQEKSTNLGEVCGKCHVMSPLPHTQLELEMPRATIWLWLSFAPIFIVYQPINVHQYNIVTKLSLQSSFYGKRGVICGCFADLWRSTHQHWECTPGQFTLV